MKGSKVGKIIGWVFVGIGIAAALGLVLGLGLQWLWNQLMPEIFGLPPISYWQAVGLFVLAHLLFKGHHHQAPPHRCDSDKRPFRDSGASGSHESPIAKKIHRLLEGDDDTPRAPNAEG